MPSLCNGDLLLWEESSVFPHENAPGVFLAGARYREELSQRALAEMTGIPQRHISEMENGKDGGASSGRLSPADATYLLVDIFNSHSVESLLDGEGAHSFHRPHRSRLPKARHDLLDVVQLLQRETDRLRAIVGSQHTASGAVKQGHISFKQLVLLRSVAEHARRSSTLRRDAARVSP